MSDVCCPDTRDPRRHSGIFAAIAQTIEATGGMVPVGRLQPPGPWLFQDCARDDVRWLVTKDGAGEEKTAENRRGPGLNGKREGPWMADGPDGDQPIQMSSEIGLLRLDNALRRARMILRTSMHAASTQDGHATVQALVA